MTPSLPRRRFLKKSLAASMAAPLVLSLEEHRLSVRAADAPGPDAPAIPKADKWMGAIGNVKISRLICGGNLISGYAHSRDLIYVSNLLKHYFTDEKIMETWSLCERHGINTMVYSAEDPNAIRVYREYRKRGGKIQYIAQMHPDPERFNEAVDRAVEENAVAAFLGGNLGDRFSKERRADKLADAVAKIQSCGLLAGIAGHEVRTPMLCAKEGIKPDFFVKTLHQANYWSKRQPGQDKDVIDNYGVDNYWCKDPDETAAFMATVKQPWIAYKVLAAGAISPKSGFQHAFRSGADFALVGMFDFQVAEDVTAANQVLADKMDRKRAWMA